MMIKMINTDQCNACMVCVDVCPMDVLRVDEYMQLPVIRYPEDCMTCYSCELQCPKACIVVDPFREPIPEIIRYAEVADNE